MKKLGIVLFALLAAAPAHAQANLSGVWNNLRAMVITAETLTAGSVPKPGARSRVIKASTACA